MREPGGGQRCVSDAAPEFIRSTRFDDSQRLCLLEIAGAMRAMQRNAWALENFWADVEPALATGALCP